MNVDSLIQVAIAITGVLAIWLTNDSNIERRKYASIFRLLGQPFWVYTTYVTAQWGIFILSIVYTFAWLRGFKNNWLTTD